ncbi:MAG: hypothetical protein IKA73_00160 [Alphaproteobacteria bacterium]|nr:hypothetical protein [Alphaproteobacteria bacterium]
MTKMNLFLEATERMRASGSEADQAADMKNWFLVHATKYLPRRNKNGDWFIPTTAMATDFEVPRSTIHFTLNHIVTGHMYGNWDEQPYIVVMPYMDVVAKNGKPAEIALVDTWFSPNPDAGIVLPQGARIVRPVKDLPDGQLVAVRGNEVVYKSIDFTDEEERLILSKLDAGKRARYDSLSNGDFTDMDIKIAVNNMGAVGKKLYEGAKDKKAFLRGLFANDREAVLGQFVRDIAFEVCIRDMGGRVWHDVWDGSELAEAVQHVALGQKIDATAANKGHSSSLEAEIEHMWFYIDSFLVHGFWMHDDKVGLLGIGDDLKSAMEFIQRGKIYPGVGVIIQALASEKPVDFMAVFKPLIHDYDNMLKSAAIRTKGTPYEGILPPGCENLAQVKPNLDITLKRWCAKTTERFEKWRSQVKQLPEYPEFIAGVRAVANEIAVQNVMGRSGR